jgi:hypothetical protein
MNLLPTTSWLPARFCNTKDHNISGVHKALTDHAAWWVGCGQTYRLLIFAQYSFGLYFLLAEGSIILRDLGVVLLIILGGPD